MEVLDQIKKEQQMHKGIEACIKIQSTLKEAVSMIHQVLDDIDTCIKEIQKNIKNDA